jgi:hypothetical protein
MNSAALVKKAFSFFNLGMNSSILRNAGKEPPMRTASNPLLRPGARPELAEWISPLLRRPQKNLAACFSWRQTQALPLEAKPHPGRPEAATIGNSPFEIEH